MRFGVILILPALLLTLLFSSCHEKRMKRLPLGRGQEQEAIVKSLRFLISSQNKNGSWGKPGMADPAKWDFMGSTASFHTFQVATTSLICMALMETRDLPDLPDSLPALRNGILFLLNTEPSRRSTADELYSVWALIFTAQCLMRAKDFPRLEIPAEPFDQNIPGWLEQLRRQQGIDGGWGYYDFSAKTQAPSGESMSFTTAAALIMLKEAEAKGFAFPKKNRDAGIQALCRARRPDGAYLYGVQSVLWPDSSSGNIKGSLGRTQACNLALFLHGKDIRTRDLKRSLDWFFNHHHFLEIARGRPYPHETWYANAGYYYNFAHLHAALAIQTLPEKDQGECFAKLAQIYLNAQQKEGSWWDYPRDYGYTNYYGTGMALRGFLLCYKARHLKDS